jgi:hypothetical protein
MDHQAKEVPCKDADHGSLAVDAEHLDGTDPSQIRKLVGRAGLPVGAKVTPLVMASTTVIR